MTEDQENCGLSRGREAKIRGTLLKYVSRQH